ncbi:MAG TPA: hypothetical protein VHS30_08400 [Streptosporangiaceae bacterium]|nr:hypothetical protein [Streptosporangiaceae bacterium]
MPLTFGVLAAVAASSPPSDDVTPGVLGFLVVAAIGVALVFLLRSMNKQFRKIAPKDEAAVPGDAGSEPAPDATAAHEAPK